MYFYLVLKHLKELVSWWKDLSSMRNNWRKLIKSKRKQLKLYLWKRKIRPWLRASWKSQWLQVFQKRKMSGFDAHVFIIRFILNHRCLFNSVKIRENYSPSIPFIVWQSFFKLTSLFTVSWKSVFVFFLAFENILSEIDVSLSDKVMLAYWLKGTVFDYMNLGLAWF